MSEAVEHATDEGVPVKMAGETLAPGYVVTEHLDRSYYLDIYEVWSEERACSCVAKVMRPDRAGDRGVRASLKREGCLLKRLMHPHIVRAYEWIERPEPAVILETIPGDALDYILLYPLQTGPAQA